MYIYIHINNNHTKQQHQHKQQHTVTGRRVAPPPIPNRMPSTRG